MRARRITACIVGILLTVVVPRELSVKAQEIAHGVLPSPSSSTSFPAITHDIGKNPRGLYLRAGTIDLREETSLLVPGVVFSSPRHYVIQIDGPMTPERRSVLNERGVVLGAYLPMYAYVVWMDGVRAEALLELGFVLWVGEYRPAWKVSPEIGRKKFITAERQQLEAAGRKRLVVELFEEGDWPGLRAWEKRESARVMAGDAAQRRSRIEVEATGESIERLRDLAEVFFVEEAPEGEPRNASSTWVCQSNVANQMPIWDAGLHGEGQLAGVIDWAMWESHCSFSDPVANPIGPNHRKIEAYYGLGSYSIYAYHGTHVVGTLLGEDLSYSDPNLRGLAYAARVVFQHYDTVISPTSLNDRLLVAHGHGARVHSNSWGSSDRSYINWSRDIDLFTHDNEDDLVLVAVTNDAVQVQAPENAKNCLAVAATQDAPSQDSKCYGGYGPTLDGRQKPEIWAPGCGSISAGISSTCDTRSGGGTSYACPAVAAMGLLARQYYLSGFYPTGQALPEDAFVPSGALLKATLLNATVDMTGLSGYFTPQEGWGRVLLDNALYFNRAGGYARRMVVSDVRHASGLSTGQVSEQYLTVTSSVEPLKITLVWNDVPATLGASYTPVNDLDLVVTDPLGTAYRGNVFSGLESATGGAADARNNVEQVVRLSPLAGIWKVSVHGTAVNQSTQGYAVVVTGPVALLLGDMNGDGKVDGRDVQGFLNAILNTGGVGVRERTTADMDQNGVLNMTDVTLMVNRLVS